MSAPARNELTTALELLKDHHMNSAGQPWPELTADAFKLAAGAQRPQDTYPAINYVIKKLAEKHTFLWGADDFKAAMAGEHKTPEQAHLFGPPEGERLAGSIGLIRVPGFVGDEPLSRDYVHAIRAPLSQFYKQHICRIIVDLRGNVGGDLYPMLSGLVSLLGKPPYGYWQKTGTAGVQAWTVPDHPILDGPVTSASVTPAPYADPAPRSENASVAVLLDRATASSGEFVAMAFEGRAHTRFFGETSAGYVTTNIPYPLPDGAQLAVSVGWANDRLGRPYREAIVPDVSLPRGQVTIDTAIDWLKSTSCGVGQ